MQQIDEERQNTTLVKKDVLGETREFDIEISPD
jgi:hypothetical protein